MAESNQTPARGHKRQTSRASQLQLTETHLRRLGNLSEQIAPRPMRPVVNTDLSHGGLRVSERTSFPDEQERPSTPRNLSPSAEGALTPTSQPLSLPSPSISPVHNVSRHEMIKNEHTPHAHPGSPTLLETPKPSDRILISGPPPSILRIPDLVSSFDTLHPNVQTYVMYQFLRRCNKLTLQFVAGVVNLTLKCDFLALLPLELSLGVLKYLDAKSLCRAAQVSRRWRAVVDTDEWMWKNLFVESGFTLEDGELDNTVRSCRLADDCSEVERGAIVELQNSRLEGSTAKRHLFKSIFRRHYMIRRNWTTNDAKPRHISFYGHGRNVVTCLQFDAEKLITGSDDTCINVYNTQTGQLRRILHGHEGGVWALQYVGSRLVSGSTDRTVRIWDIERGVCTHVFYGHTSTVRCLQIMMPTEVGKTPDGNPILLPKSPVIVTGSRDSSLKVWKLPEPQDPEFHPIVGPDEVTTANNPFFLRSLVGHSHSVRAISGYADTLVSGSYDNTVRVWRVSNGECTWRLSGHQQKVYSVVIDPKRNRCVSGSMDWMVKVWSLETGTCIWTLEGHTSLVGLLDLSHDALVSAAADSTLRIWDPDNGNCRHVLSAHTGAITCFQHDEQKVISGSDGTLKMWDIKTGRFIRDLLTGLSGVWQLKMDERTLVAAVQRDGVTFIEVLDFGASPDTPNLGQRIVINQEETVAENSVGASDED